MVRKLLCVCSVGAPPPPQFAISDIRSGERTRKKKKAFHSCWNLLLKSRGIFVQLRVIHKSQNEPAGGLIDLADFPWAPPPERQLQGKKPCSAWIAALVPGQLGVNACRRVLLF